jgi:hypothetical protein
MRRCGTPILGQPVLADAHRLQEFVHQDFTGCG